MFKGAITAIVTPFAEDGEFDEASMRCLVDFQVENKIEGIVPCGTTGESPTLEHKEHKKVVQTVIDAANGKTKVIAGARRAPEIPFGVPQSRFRQRRMSRDILGTLYDSLVRFQNFVFSSSKPCKIMR